MGRAVKPRAVPLREILFAAKTGFLSKPLWHEFFAQRSRAQNARIWNNLMDQGYFRSHPSKMLRNVLVLAPKALEVLQKQGLVAVTHPHISLFDHDEKVARIALCLEKASVVNDFTTEAELKKKFMLWMKTAPEGKSTKFPDLILDLRGTGQFQRVAIEVEQSLKSLERYKSVMNSYANAKTIQAVIFISDQQTIFNRIGRAMTAVHYPSWERPVGFGLMNEWLKSPDTANIHLSRGVASIRQWTSLAKENLSLNK